MNINTILINNVITWVIFSPSVSEQYPVNAAIWLVPGAAVFFDLAHCQRYPYFPSQDAKAWVTRLTLASILGPFGVHLLKFTLDTHPGSLMHYLGLLEFPVIICGAFNTHHINTQETYLVIYRISMIAVSSLDFLLLSCLHIRLRNTLLKITGTWARRV